MHSVHLEDAVSHFYHTGAHPDELVAEPASTIGEPTGNTLKHYACDDKKNEAGEHDRASKHANHAAAERHGEYAHIHGSHVAPASPTIAKGNPEE